MKVVWEVEDGYAGKSRPQTTDVDDGDLEACESQEEREQVISDAIDHDFSQRIVWACDVKQYAADFAARP